MGRVKALLMDMIEHPEEYDYSPSDLFPPSEAKEDLEEVEDEEGPFEP